MLLYSFCLSGGAARFMDKVSYQKYFGTHAWPIYLMVTAGPMEPALGGFLELWSRRALVRELWEYIV